MRVGSVAIVRLYVVAVAGAAAIVVDTFIGVIGEFDLFKYLGRICEFVPDKSILGIAGAGVLDFIRVSGHIAIQVASAAAAAIITYSITAAGITAAATTTSEKITTHTAAAEA